MFLTCCGLRVTAIPAYVNHVCLVSVVLQGNDAVGRPLLERALAIQEKALGPDHPDVLAIKDVLNSE